MTIKTPEEVAADTIGGYVSDFAARRGSRPTLIDRDAAEALIIQAIEADRAQRSYVATVQVGGYDPHRMTVTPAPGQSIVDALIEQGDGSVQDEWSLVDVEAVRA